MAEQKAREHGNLAEFQAQARGEAASSLDNIVVASVVNPDESRGGGGGGGGGSGTLTEVLRELQAAFQQGLLTKEEFEAAKEKALESMIRGGTASGYVQAAVAEPAEAQPSRVIVSGAGDHSFDGEYVRDKQGGTGSGRGDAAGARFRNQEMQEEMPRSAAMERGDVFDRSRYPNGGPRRDQDLIGVAIVCLPNMIMCPLHCFSMCGCADLVGCLTSLPCSAIPCTPCDPNGKQPLWFCAEPIGYAASFGQLHTVMELVKNGANPHRRNGAGQNAWSDARRERHQHVVDWLDAWQAAGSPRRGGHTLGRY